MLFRGLFGDHAVTERRPGSAPSERGQAAAQKRVHEAVAAATRLANRRSWPWPEGMILAGLESALGVKLSPLTGCTAMLFRGLFGDHAVTERDGKQMMSAGAAQVELATPEAVTAEFGEAAALPRRARGFPSRSRAAGLCRARVLRADS
jgi:hypothetical protein